MRCAGRADRESRLAHVHRRAPLALQHGGAVPGAAGHGAEDAELVLHELAAFHRVDREASLEQVRLRRVGQLQAGDVRSGHAHRAALVHHFRRLARVPLGALHRQRDFGRRLRDRARRERGQLRGVQLHGARPVGDADHADLPVTVSHIVEVLAESLPNVAP